MERSAPSSLRLGRFDSAGFASEPHQSSAGDRVTERVVVDTCEFARDIFGQLIECDAGFRFWIFRNRKCCIRQRP